MNKEVLAAVGTGAGKIGKAILVEGTKAVALNTAQAVIKQSFDGGFGSVTDLELDELLKGGKKKEPKKAMFSFKKKGTEDNLEAEVDVEFEDKSETIDDDVETVKAEDIKVEKVNDKSKNARKTN